MPDQERARVEKVILAVLRSASEPMSVGELVGRVRDERINEALARVTLWDLIDQEHIELTSERKLQLPTASVLDS